MDQCAGTVVSADDKSWRAVHVHVVRAGLRIVFEDENRSVFPVWAARDGFDQFADGVIVFSHEKLRRRMPGAHARGVIIRKAHDRQVRHAVCPARYDVGHITAKFIKPIAQTRITAKAGVRMVVRDDRVDAASGLFGRTIGIGRHRIWCVLIEVAESLAEMAFERAFGGEGFDRRRQIRVSLGTVRVDGF